MPVAVDFEVQAMQLVSMLVGYELAKLCLRWGPVLALVPHCSVLH
jgi:hypothetical protein